MAASRPGVIQYFGTPRDLAPGSKPRFLELDGVGLDSDVPWAPNSNPPIGISYARRNRSSRVSIRSGSRQNGKYGELWMGNTQSLVEFGQHSGPGQEQPYPGSQTEHRLTPAPRRIAQQTPITRSGEYLNGWLVKRPLKRKIIASLTSSQFLKAWMLEETGDGAGVAHCWRATPVTREHSIAHISTQKTPAKANWASQVRSLPPNA